MVSFVLQQAHASCLGALAGAEGFEPPRPVLETGSLAVELTPLKGRGWGLGAWDWGIRPTATHASLRFSPASSPESLAPALLHFLMQGVVPARRAELLELQPVLLLLLVLRCRVIAVLTVAALQCNDLSHKTSLQLPAISFQHPVLSS